MKNLTSLTITSAPNGDEADASHLKQGQLCAITETGLNEHNSHNLVNTLVIGTGVGVVALPAVIGGGIGLAMGGEAIGLGLVELGIVGGGTGATIAKIVDKPKTGHLIDGKHETLALVDMVGVVVSKKNRWFDMPGQDVRVKWFAKDAQGRETTFSAYHNPEQLFGLG